MFFRVLLKSIPQKIHSTMISYAKASSKKTARLTTGVATDLYTGVKSAIRFAFGKTTPIPTIDLYDPNFKKALMDLSDEDCESLHRKFPNSRLKMQVEIEGLKVRANEEVDEYNKICAVRKKILVS